MSYKFLDEMEGLHYNTYNSTIIHRTPPKQHTCVYLYSINVTVTRELVDNLSLWPP